MLLLLPVFMRKTIVFSTNILDHFFTPEDFTRNSTFTENDLHLNAIDFTHSRKVDMK